MTNLQRQIYSAILRLHPSAFRDQFGREMMLDFEDALDQRGFAPLLGDAVFSLARQWKSRAFDGPEPDPALTPAIAQSPDHPFLAGQYLAIDCGSPLNAFDLASASVLSILLVLTIGFAASIPNRRAISIQPGLPVSHDGGLGVRSNQPSQPTSAAGPGRREAEPDYTRFAAVPGAYPSLRYRLFGRLPEAYAPSLNQKTRVRMVRAESWAEFLLRCALITAIVWLFSLLLRRTRTLPVRVALATLGLLGVAASALASPLHTPPIHPQVHSDKRARPLAFDVVSIREDKALSPSSIPLQPMTRDGYHFKSVPMFALIQEAFAPSQSPRLNFRPGQVIGAPDWLFSARYDINAKVSEADMPLWNDPAQQPATRRAMLQALLADRLKLVVHREMRTMPIFELSVGKNGPKFKPAEPLTPAEIRQQHPGVITMGDGAMVASGPNPGQQMLFGVTMQTFAWFLTNTAGRPVHDNTGLTGKYDISYQLELPASQPEGAAPPDYYSLQIHTIVEDQLGLKLTSTKGPAEVLVIDHIEKPSEN